MSPLDTDGEGLGSSEHRRVDLSFHLGTAVGILGSPEHRCEGSGLPWGGFSSLHSKHR